MSGVSTKHVVLGLLVERPGYGYDLGQRLDARLGFLGLSENVVYRILDRLEDEGWIEEIGKRSFGRTRRGAARVMYGPTQSGVERFREWIAEPNDRAVLRDELRTKLVLADPGDLPRLRAAAEEQARECLAELELLRRPLLAEAASDEVPWSNAAAILVDDFETALAAVPDRLARRGLRRARRAHRGGVRERAMTPLLQLDAVEKAYVRGPRELRVLRDATLAVEPGEFVGVYGARGAGKTTLLRIAAGF